MNIVIDDKTYQVEIIKKNNRNTYIRVKNGKIIDRIKTITDTSVSNCATLFIDNDKVYVSFDSDSIISLRE